MFLKKLKLTNFRNYLDFEQNFNYLKTIITGQNAQGKSNILEAINILATSGSDRADKDNDLIYWNKEYALIFANIETKDSNLEITLQINSTGRRKLKINGVAKKAPQADLVGNFFNVMFSCDDLFLIKGSPSIRRKWLDSILFQLDLKYHRNLQDYQKSVAQKNALLKNAQERGISKKDLKDQLEIWNEQLINFGSEIIFTRIKFTEDLKPIAGEFLSDISKQTEDLDLIYKSMMARAGHDLPLQKIKIIFREQLDESFEEELARGQSLIGPHRDDLIFLINNKEAHSFASQGQQRSIVLAIKLSELKIIEKRKNEIPVLLLDDVFAELDESRQDFLLHHLPENIQTFLTTTHLTDIQKEFLKDAQVFKIRGGKVLENEKAKI
ncbi:MAG: DNA replication/repair protein RecF [Candidatus Melainabacteria bacterium]|nr:DNA replication/repair protein RecF [Candidatus Melainabacteria bacterium]